jgi:hypothetical protein
MSWKIEAVCLTGHGVPKVYKMSRQPYFLDFRLNNGYENVSLTCWPAVLYDQEDSWYSFLLGAEWTRTTVLLEGLGQFKT